MSRPERFAAPRGVAAGLVAVAVGVALYLLACAWAEPYPADANIGAGLLGLAGIAAALGGAATLAVALVAVLLGRLRRR
jgi:hypothetical protein